MRGILRTLGLGMTGCVLTTLPAASQAVSDSDLAAIRQQIQSLKNDYEGRLRALEQRLQQAESDAAAARKAAADAAGRPPPAPVAALPRASGQPAAPSSPSAFNPGIGVVLNGSYAHTSRGEDARIPGFVLGDEAGGPKRGFSLGESEIAASANIDQALYGTLILSFDEDAVSVEEAYIQTTGLPYGFTIKGGRFFSGIGYINERHAHDWDFVDAPLPYRAILNGQYGDDGVQIRWLAPTDWYLEFAGEAFRGDAFPAGNAANDGVGSWSLFARTGGDINDSSSWLASLGFLRTKANRRDIDGDVFDGRDNVLLAGLVYKWAPDGNPTRRNLIVNGEYIRDWAKGAFNDESLDSTRWGWYLQAVYQFMPQWRIGYRYDEVRAGAVPEALAGSMLDAGGHVARGNTAMLEFDTSEFGRFRLQYTRDDSDRTPDDKVVFQYTVILGPHGAHRF